MNIPSPPFSQPRSGSPRHPAGLLALAAVGILAISAAALAWQGPAQAHEQPVLVAAPAQDVPASGQQTETAVLAGGCFWGIQGVYQHVRGVQRVVSGYAGGSADTAHYGMVGTGRTGHAESVEITFDPSQVSYGTLLRIFFSVAHDPTELNRQGPDVGTQYRSAIFPMDESQQRVAQAYIAQLDAAHTFGQAIVTRIEPYTGFYPAESYHQDFMARNPTNPYIVYNDKPKVEHLEKLFPQRFRTDPVLLGAG